MLDRFSEGGAGFVVPDLFWGEIANILWKAVRTGRISEASADEAIDWFQSLSIPTRPAKPLMEDALAIALSLDQPVYDCLYIALAIVSGQPLVTADERLVRRAGAMYPVRWLGAEA